MFLYAHMMMRTNFNDRFPVSPRGNSSTSMVKKEAMNDSGSCISGQRSCSSANNFRLQGETYKDNGCNSKVHNRLALPVILIVDLVDSPRQLEVSLLVLQIQQLFNLSSSHLISTSFANNREGNHINLPLG